MVTKPFDLLRVRKVMIAFTGFLFLTCNYLSGQGITYNYFYRVYFIDKGENHPGNYTSLDLLSVKAVERRQKAGIAVPEFRDIPVYSRYIDQVSALGFKLHCTSKWMNTALFKTEALTEINTLMSLPFVSDVKIVKNTAGKTLHYDKLSFATEQSDLPPYDRPVSMLNGNTLHSSGFDGKGILIAVLDGGFINADHISSLTALRNREGIRGTFDFVNNNEFVYNYHNHGTAVLSVLAGEINGLIEGTAPGADYWLLRTEDSNSEFPVEEDFWAAGAEFADSIGADIISSSLGYFTFDDPLLNYKYSDMDGNSTFVTQVADIAAAKGILVVCSAGNERNNDWIHIIAPSDGDSVLAVGAVDGNNTISSFSSAGPSADNRVKPDIVAQGVSVPVQTQPDVVARANGTSFSCPVLSGMCACVIQAVPKATGSQIFSAIYSASDRYLFPDSLYGYGIPDIARVINHLQELLVTKPDNESVVSPNPFTNDFVVTFKNIPGWLRIEVFTASGKLILRRNYKDYISRSITITDLQEMEQGLYFIRLNTTKGTFTHKLIKISN